MQQPELESEQITKPVMKNTKKTFVSFALTILIGLLVWSVANASQWDEQIQKWSDESLRLQAEQIPQLEQLARKGDVRAAYLLYLESAEPRYQYGQRSSANEVGQWGLALANAGNPIGMRMLCYLFAQGEGGLKRNETEAVRWCQRGAQAGFGSAMASLGAMHENGEAGLSKDQVIAVDWYRKAAEAGSGRGMVYLAWAFEFGRGGLIKDEVKALKWYIKSAEAGDGTGMVGLGWKYESGWAGLKKDEAKAVEWYRKSAEAGNSQGMNNFGASYQHGKGGLPVDNKKAVEWYRKSAEAGNGQAMDNLGYMYKHGLGGLEKNDTKAVEWFRKGADLGNVFAMTSLAMAYRDGSGVAQDYVKEAEWFRKGAEAGYGLSMAGLGQLYKAGHAVPKDLAIARQWYEKAIAAGEPYGFEAMGETYQAQDDFVTANAWYKKAAEAGISVGMVNLAESYQRGRGIGRDYRESARWYSKALQSTQTHAYNDSGQTAAQRARERLDEMLASGVISDPALLREINGLSKPAPRLAWLDAPATTDNETVEFAFGVIDDGGGIGNVQFKLDGVAFNPNQGRNAKLFESGERRIFTVHLPPGRHEVAVLAYNAENLINFREIKHVVTSSFKQIRKPQLHAVVVGIDQYDNDSLKLRYAGNDARDVARLLKTRGPGLFDDVQITLLDQRASTGKTAILQAIKDAASKVQTEDVFVFYVAGHGMSDDQFGYHMLTADVRLMSDERLRENSISAEELQKAIYNVPSGKKVVLLDTCQSGKGLNADTLLGKRGMENLDMVNRMNRKSGAVVMAASESKEQALEGYEGHGLFTYALLEALNGKADVNKDGMVSTRELQDYVEARASELAEKLFKAKQSPYPSSVGQGFNLMAVQ